MYVGRPVPQSPIRLIDACPQMQEMGFISPIQYPNKVKRIRSSSSAYR